MNKKDQRYKGKSVSYRLSVGSKTYSVGQNQWEKDPFIEMIDELREKVKGSDGEELEDIIEMEINEIAVQAYLAEDSEVLHSLVRILDDISDRDKSPFGEEIIQNLFNPNIVRIEFCGHPLLAKTPVLKEVFRIKRLVDRVTVFREGEELGVFQGSNLILLSGKYRSKVETGEETFEESLIVEDDNELILNK